MYIILLYWVFRMEVSNINRFPISTSASSACLTKASWLRGWRRSVSQADMSYPCWTHIMFTHVLGFQKYTLYSQYVNQTCQADSEQELEPRHTVSLKWLPLCIVMVLLLWDTCQSDAIVQYSTRLFFPVLECFGILQTVLFFSSVFPVEYVGSLWNGFEASGVLVFWNCFEICLQWFRSSQDWLTSIPVYEYPHPQQRQQQRLPWTWIQSKHARSTLRNIVAKRNVISD